MSWILQWIYNLTGEIRDKYKHISDTGGSVPDCHNKVNNAIKKGALIFWFASVYNGEGNDTPLQYSCLENPIDRGAW